MVELIRAHKKKYPQMQIVDAVKLLYQGEFGGGHMILDARESMKRLRAEVAGLPADAGSACALFEGVGLPGDRPLARLHLARIPGSGLSLRTVNGMFTHTADTVSGFMPRFVQKLEDFQRLCAQGALPFDAGAVSGYLSEYRGMGCPPVHHSEVYRRHYMPAYRVVDGTCEAYLEVFRRIDALLEKNEGVLVAVDGNSGAGKSTLGALIAGVYRANLLHMDDFFLRPGQRAEARLSQPGGNIDYERFFSEALLPLSLGRSFAYRPFDCRDGELMPPVFVRARRVAVVEGCYSMHPYFGDRYDLRIFLRAAPEVQRERILERNGPRMLKRFEGEWIPMENRYFETFSVAQGCDLIFDT